MNICASLQFHKDDYLTTKDNYLTTEYSRNLLLAMSLVECLNSSYKLNLVAIFIFVNIDNPSSDDESWSWLKDNVSTWLQKLFYDAHFTKWIEFLFDDTEKTSGTIVLGGIKIPIRFIYNDDLVGTNIATTVENMILVMKNTEAKLLLTTSNFPFILWNMIHNAYMKLKILLVEGASANATKTLPISSISDMSKIWQQLENDSEKYAAYSVGINDIFIKVLQTIDTIDNSALIEDLKTNNSFFELINTNPLEITSSGNNIASSVPTMMPELNGKIDKIKYIRTFATSLKNKGDKIIIKLNSIKIINKQITEDSLNESIIKNFNETTSSWPNCEFVDRSVNVKETDKLYFILTDTTCKEIQTIQTDDKIIYEYDLRLVFETDSIMRYMSKLVLLIVNYLSTYLSSK